MLPSTAMDPQAELQKLLDRQESLKQELKERKKRAAGRPAVEERNPQTPDPARPIPHHCRRTQAPHPPPDPHRLLPRARHRQRSRQAGSPHERARGILRTGSGCAIRILLVGQIEHPHPGPPGDFKKYFLLQLKKVEQVYRNARVENTERGLLLKPSPPHVRMLKPRLGLRINSRVRPGEFVQRSSRLLLARSARAEGDGSREFTRERGEAGLRGCLSGRRSQEDPCLVWVAWLPSLCFHALHHCRVGVRFPRGDDVPVALAAQTDMGELKAMKRKRNSLISVGEVVVGLDWPVKHEEPLL